MHQRLYSKKNCWKEKFGFLISKKLNVIIIGCGLIGNKRAKFLNNKFSKLVYCCDIKEKKQYGCEKI